MRPGHIQVFDGLRITTEHVNHLQGAFHSALQDVREILGLGQVHAGLEVVKEGEQAITIQPSSGLNDDEIERMVQDAAQHAVDDKKRREATLARNRADSAIYSAERTLREHGTKLAQSDKDEVEARITAVRQALEGDDLEALASAVQALQTAVQNASVPLYEGTEEAGDAGQTDAGSAAGDDVIDGEIG